MRPPYPVSWLLAASITVAAGLASAQDIALREDHPQQYEVAPGDTLWDISLRFLQNPWQWPEIWQANPQIANPHLIYPGDIIRMVYVDGQPRLVVDNGEPIQPPAPPRATSSNLRRVRLSPRIRSRSRDAKAVPTISLDDIRSFITDTVVMDVQALKDIPYVLSASGDRSRFIVPPDRFYAHGNIAGNTEVYGIYRRGRDYRDILEDSPRQGDLLGVQMRRIGSARIESRHDKASLMTLLNSSEEVRMEDFVLPMQDLQARPTYLPVAAPAGTTGRIIALESGSAHEFKYGVVAVNHGSNTGLRHGHVLAVMRPEGSAKARSGQTVQLPDRRVGLVLVFRVFADMSYAMVMETSTGLKEGDKITSP